MIHGGLAIIHLSYNERYARVIILLYITPIILNIIYRECTL